MGPRPPQARTRPWCSWRSPSALAAADRDRGRDRLHEQLREQGRRPRSSGTPRARTARRAGARRPRRSSSTSRRARRCAATARRSRATPTGRTTTSRPPRRWLKSTPKSVRDRAYTAIAVRSGKDVGYELWVFPTERKFKLVRLLGREQAHLPRQGREQGDQGPGQGEPPRPEGRGLEDHRQGQRDQAPREDRGPQRGTGRRAQGRGCCSAQEASAPKPVSMTVDDLELQVPNP